MCKPYHLPGANHIFYVWWTVKDVSEVGRIACPPFGGFFHERSQYEERFPFKPASQELGKRISFSIKRLKTLDTLKNL
jgi:hypothetical protein